MERHKLVELQGPGGRCLVPEKEKEAYLKRKGWKEITPEEKIEEALEKEEVKEPEKPVEDKPEKEEKDIPEEDMDTPAEPVEPKKLIPTTREVMKSRTSALSKLVDEFELKVDLNEYDSLNDKRRAVDSALNDVRGV